MSSWASSGRAAVFCTAHLVPPCLYAARPVWTACPKLCCVEFSVGPPDAMRQHGVCGVTRTVGDGLVRGCRRVCAQVREDGHGEVQIVDLEELAVGSADELLALIDEVRRMSIPFQFRSWIGRSSRDGGKRGASGEFGRRGGRSSGGGCSRVAMAAVHGVSGLCTSRRVLEKRLVLESRRCSRGGGGAMAERRTGWRLQRSFRREDGRRVTWRHWSTCRASPILIHVSHVEHARGQLGAHDAEDRGERHVVALARHLPDRAARAPRRRRCGRRQGARLTQRAGVGGSVVVVTRRVVVEQPEDPDS